MKEENVGQVKVQVSRKLQPDGVTWPLWWHSLMHNRPGREWDGTDWGESSLCTRWHIEDTHWSCHSYTEPVGVALMIQTQASTQHCWWCIDFYFKTFLTPTLSHFCATMNKKGPKKFTFCKKKKKKGAPPVKKRGKIDFKIFLFVYINLSTKKIWFLFKIKYGQLCFRC